ncbi:MAG: DUF87 domain-containing protein [Bacteroidales bacterium]|nr:DUF87 domain-containing protein [Bacteroidales bacterium]
MKIGKIILVEYNQFRVRLFQSTRNSTTSIDGSVYYFGNIGSYLKTCNVSGEVIICEVVSVMDYVSPNASVSKYNLDSSREIVLKPLGTINRDNEFSLGVGIFPSLYADVEIVLTSDLDLILEGVKDAEKDISGIHKSFNIGVSKSMLNYQINLNINSFFNIHTAILGNSGSGKSNTVAHILQQVFRKDGNYAIGAKTILFDSNGEYKKAFSSAGLTNEIDVKFYKPTTIESNLDNGQESFHMPYYLMNLDEWLGFLMASELTQKPFWDKVLQTTFKFYKIVNQSGDDNTSFVNYFKWKILNILALVNSQIDSDTARITAARSVIFRCGQLLVEEERLKPIKDFLSEAEGKCTISFGDNKSELLNFIASKNDEVDEDSAMSIDVQKLQPGEYYDYRFLTIAVEMTLLEEEARGNVRIREYASTMITRLDYFLNNPECAFMKSEKQDYKNVDDYLRLVFGIKGDDKEKQLIVIDSSEINSETLELLTSVVSRMLFDYRKRLYGEARRQQPVHLIMDEAHRYIRKGGGYILRENVFEKIAREGRKYSLYLMISSQRPSELSETVLSQCGNYIVHRIQNEIDLKYVYSVLPYFSEDFVSKIKQSVPGEALIFGTCVPMPLQVKVPRAEPDPDSDNCKVSEEWFAGGVKQQ